MGRVGPLRRRAVRGLFGVQGRLQTKDEVVRVSIFHLAHADTAFVLTWSYDWLSSALVRCFFFRAIESSTQIL